MSLRHGWRRGVKGQGERAKRVGEVEEGEGKEGVKGGDLPFTHLPDHPPTHPPLRLGTSFDLTSRRRLPIGINSTRRIPLR